MMDKTRYLLPKIFSLISPRPSAPTGGHVVRYFWTRSKQAVVKRQVAKEIEKRKLRVRKQKSEMKEKIKSIDKKLKQRIVNLSSEDLLKELAEDRLTASQVLEAYQAQSFQVDLQTNCITEYLEDAEEIANDLDSKSEKGPLHGLPVSVKETYAIKDLDCTAGVAYLLNKPRSKDSVIVGALKELGAVIFARTNIVQTTFSFGHSNPIYGATMNPYNSKRIPGGSTAGEGALIGGLGSLVGFGTDVGGSVRIPAAMSGHYSLKPTQRRLSGDGIKPSLPGLVGLHDCPGIMSREIQAIITVFRALVNHTMFEMDPRVIPLKFQEKLFTDTKPLTIGYYENDGIIGPAPGCRRAVRVAKSILEKMGHKLVQFTIPDIGKVHELTMTFPGVDGGQELDKALWYEPKIDECMDYARKGFFHRLKESITRKHYLNVLGTPVIEKSAYELWQLMTEREEYVDLFIGTMKQQDIDVILAPGYALPACTPEFIDATGGTLFFTMMYNMLNFPAGAVPVTRETKEDQQALANYTTGTKLQQAIKKATKGAIGMPLGIQIVGLPWREEMVLRVMKDLDKGIKKRLVPEAPTPPIRPGAA